MAIQDILQQWFSAIIISQQKFLTRRLVTCNKTDETNCYRTQLLNRSFSSGRSFVASLSIAVENENMLYVKLIECKAVTLTVKMLLFTCRQNSYHMMLYIFVREHSFVVENMINENVIAVVARIGKLWVPVIVVVVLQYFASLVDNPLMKASQEVRLSLILLIPRR